MAKLFLIEIVDTRELILVAVVLALYNNSLGLWQYGHMTQTGQQNILSPWAQPFPPVWELSISSNRDDSGIDSDAENKGQGRDLISETITLKNC